MLEPCTHEEEIEPIRVVRVRVRVGVRVRVRVRL
jgi:hypothetical protein